MTDLHTHILPGMDDGACSVDESLAMLRMERDDGVDAVMLTPHYYAEHETPDAFLHRRQSAVDALLRRLDALPAAERETLPALYLGAEVAWGPNIAGWKGLERLCCGTTGRHLLLELPTMPWHSGLIGELYELMSRTGLTPILAHIDRYLPVQPRGILEELLRMGLPTQLSADALLHLSTRHSALKLIRRGQAQLLISDCHNTAHRAPCMGAAAAVLEHRLGAQRADRYLAQSDTLLQTLTHKINER